jgi:hypothetical protein
MQLLVMASFIAAQTSSSSLQGTVTGPSGSAIGGASVMLSSNESKLEQANVPVNPRLGERPFTILPCSPGWPAPW